MPRSSRRPRQAAAPAFDKRNGVRYVGITLFVLLLLALPQFGTGSDLIYKNLFLSTAIVALGLDVLIGRTGQLSLCQGALFGVGCFTAVQVGAKGAPWPVAFLVAIVVSALVSTIVGLPSLRIRGLQVAVATLAFQIFLISLSSTKPEIKGIGTDGIARPDYLLDDKRYYYFGLLFLGLTVLLVNRIRSTRSGRMFVSVRDVEDRSGSFGIASGPAKLLAYALAGGIAGLGGALYALQIGTPNDVSPFSLQASLILVAITVIGGAMSSMGIIVAAFFFSAFASLHYIPTESSGTVQVAFALLLVLNVVAYPRGLGGSFTDSAKQLNRLLFGPAPRPTPRPEATDAAAAAVQATALRKTPRSLRERMPTSTLLVATDVTVQYGGVRALDHFTAEVRRGEIVGLIGANGAGKSTFFNAVSGLAPTTGLDPVPRAGAGRRTAGRPLADGAGPHLAGHGPGARRHGARQPAAGPVLDGPLPGGPRAARAVQRGPRRAAGPQPGRPGARAVRPVAPGRRAAGRPAVRDDAHRRDRCRRRLRAGPAAPRRGLGRPRPRRRPTTWAPASPRCATSSA